MKTIIKALLCILMINQLAAQNYQGYYFADGVAQYWTDDSTSVNIIVGSMQHYNKIVAKLIGKEHIRLRAEYSTLDFLCLI
ncbi:MAG: hypothetical protein LBL18_01675 [Bacteroidales bacterium]|jgi:hypothetical protein|nr:hypothetical protein [Bacteroidales bacterium]